MYIGIEPALVRAGSWCCASTEFIIVSVVPCAYAPETRPTTAAAVSSNVFIISSTRVVARTARLLVTAP